MAQHPPEIPLLYDRIIVQDGEFSQQVSQDVVIITVYRAISSARPDSTTPLTTSNV
jgi:hypothetical protein